jgi:DNA polymerase-3 subunit epsilon
MNDKTPDNRDELIRTLHDLVEELRSPLANLRAAAENISTHPDISPVMRSAFENIILQESTILSDAFQALADTSRRAVQSTLHHTVLSCRALLDSLCKKISAGSNITVSCSGRPCSLIADRDDILLLLEFLVNKIAENRNISSVSCEVSPEETHVYLDLVWLGSPFSPAEIETWQRERLLEDTNSRTVGAILKEHDSDIWSSNHSTKGKSLLRIPLPISGSTQIDTASE